MECCKFKENSNIGMPIRLNLQRALEYFEVTFKKYKIYDDETDSIFKKAYAGTVNDALCKHIFDKISELVNEFEIIESYNYIHKIYESAYKTGIVLSSCIDNFNSVHLDVLHDKIFKYIKDDQIFSHKIEFRCLLCTICYIYLDKSLKNRDNYISDELDSIFIYKSVKGNQILRHIRNSLTHDYTNTTDNEITLSDESDRGDYFEICMTFDQYIQSCEKIIEYCKTKEIINDDDPIMYFYKSISNLQGDIDCRSEVCWAFVILCYVQIFEMHRTCFKEFLDHLNIQGNEKIKKDPTIQKIISIRNAMVHDCPSIQDNKIICKGGCYSLDDLHLFANKAELILKIPVMLKIYFFIGFIVRTGCVSNNHSDVE